MATVVSEITDSDPQTVSPDARVEDVVRTLRENELPGAPVVDGDGRCGIVTEVDLVLPDNDGDLHLRHYIELFGGTVSLEPLMPVVEDGRLVGVVTRVDVLGALASE